MEFNRMEIQSAVVAPDAAVQQNLSLGNRSVLKEIYTTNDGGAQVRQSIKCRQLVKLGHEK